MDPRQYGPQIFPALKTLDRKPAREPDANSRERVRLSHPDARAAVDSPDDPTEHSGEDR